MRGYAAYGAVGLGRGLFLGASGIVTKPIAGVMDVVSGAAADIVHTLHPERRQT